MYRRIALATICIFLVSWGLDDSFVPPPAAQTQETLTLPQQCRHLSHVGKTDDWFECMGVEKR